MTQSKNTRKAKKLGLAILATLVATSMAFAATAGNRRGGRGDGSGPRGDYAMTRLNLTDAQQKKIDALRDTHWTEIDRIHDEMDKIRDDIRAQWEKEKIDKSKIKSLHNKVQSLHQQVADARLKFRLAVYDILTPEQRKQVAADRRAFHQHRDDRRGAWGDCPRNGRGPGDGRGRGRGNGHGRGHGMGPMW
jgi:Spy/CpxP family protein refolding chaperone